MNIKNILILLFTTFFLSGCSLFSDYYQRNQRTVLDYLLSDLPLPDDAEIERVPTVVLGTGDAISARITLSSNFSPAENLIFYGNATPTTGWSLLSSKVGEEITLVYTKEGRYATIDMQSTTGIRSFFSGDFGTHIVVSVVHPDAIAVQMPFEGLDYNNLPNAPDSPEIA